MVHSRRGNVTFDNSFSNQTSTFFVQRCVWVVFHQINLQNEQSLHFQGFEVSDLSKSPTFINKCVWVVFHQIDDLQNDQSLLFQVFQTLKAFKLKSSDFVKRCLWITFHQTNGLQNVQSLLFQALEILEL